MDPSLCKLVHAHPNDFHYSVRQWKIIEDIKKQFGVVREMPEYPLPEEDKVSLKRKELID